MKFKNVMLIISLLLFLGCGSNSTSPENSEPINLQASLITSQKIMLSWEDVCQNETGFILQRKLINENFETIAELPANSSEYTDEGVTVWNTYYYRVAAVYNDEQSDWSNAVNIYTQPNLSELEFGTSSTLDILTWNLKEFPLVNANTINLVAEALLEMSPEVVGLQEIKSLNSFNALLDSLNSWDDENSWAGFRSTEASFEINLAVIYKSNKFVNISISEIYDNDWYAFPRPPLIFDGVYEGERIVVINNHFKASGGEDNEARRREASEKLKLYIDNNLDTENVLLIGDLNDELDDPIPDNVFQVFINDNQNFQFADMEIAYGNSSSWSYPGWPSHLDHILITNELYDEFEVEEVFTLKPEMYISGGWNYYEDNVSDHRPVGIRLHF